MQNGLAITETSPHVPLYSELLSFPLQTIIQKNPAAATAGMVRPQQVSCEHEDVYTVCSYRRCGKSMLGGQQQILAKTTLKKEFQSEWGLFRLYIALYYNVSR